MSTARVRIASRKPSRRYQSSPAAIGVSSASATFLWPGISKREHRIFHPGEIVLFERLAEPDHLVGGQIALAEMIDAELHVVADRRAHRLDTSRPRSMWPRSA